MEIPEVDVGLVGAGGGDVGEDEGSEGLALVVEPAHHNDLFAPVAPVVDTTLCITNYHKLSDNYHSSND